MGRSNLLWRLLPYIQSHQTDPHSMPPFFNILLLPHRSDLGTLFQPVSLTVTVGWIKVKQNAGFFKFKRKFSKHGYDLVDPLDISTSSSCGTSIWLHDGWLRFHGFHTDGSDESSSFTWQVGVVEYKANLNYTFKVFLKIGA